MFLSSQDKNEIFLTFPYFEKDYGKQYKNIEDLEEKNFLIMREYGPNRLISKEHMSHIARFLHTESFKTNLTQAERYSFKLQK